MAHTASGALHFGIDPAKLAAVGAYKTSPLFEPAERAAFDLAAAASAQPNAVGDPHFTELRKHWSEEQIVEIVGVIAMAGFLARWNVTMATPLEPEPNDIGEKHLATHGWQPGQHLR
jgi:alkylhydroperoxidase family enzyme